MDVKIIIEGNNTHTDIYTKNTDTFNYVPFNSCHPRHTIRNIPFVLARRIRGIASDENLTKQRMEDMKERLLAKKYPAKLIDESIKCSLQLSQEEVIAKNNSTATEKELNDTFFVTTYNPLAVDSNKRVQNAVSDFNATQPPEKQLKVRSSYRKSPSLKDLLMFRDNKAADTNGVFSCKSGCILCKNISKPENQ